MPFETAAIMFALENAALLAGGYYIARAAYSKPAGNLLLTTLVLYLSQVIIIQELLGILGLLRPLPVFTVSLVAGAIEITALRGRTSHPLVVRDERPAKASVIMTFIITLVSLKTLLHILDYIAVPPCDADSIGYHLPITASMVYTGDLFQIEAPFKYYPSNSEIIAHWLVSPFRDDLLAPLQNLAPTLAGALAVFHLARRFTVRKEAALTASLLFVTLPAVQRQLVDQENDVLLSGLFLAGISLLILYFETQRMRWLAAASLCAGIALGTKYSGVYYLAVFWTIAAIGTLKGRDKVNLVRAAAISALFVMLGGAFWYLRNYMIYASPFYPLEQGLPALSNHAPPAMSGKDYAASTLIYHWREPEVFRLLIKSFLAWSPVATISAVLSPLVIWFMRKRSEHWWVVALGAALSFCIFLVTPLVVENAPNTMNLLKEGYTPARLGLPFVMFSCLLFAVVADEALSHMGSNAFLEALLPAAVFITVWSGSNILLLAAALVMSVILRALHGYRPGWSRHMAAAALVLPAAAFVVSGPSMMARKNAVRAEVYGKWFTDAPPTGLYGFLDRNIKGCAINCVCYYGVASYAFWGPSFENPLQPFPDLEGIKKGRLEHVSGMPQLFVVTIQTMDRSRPDYLGFPETDEIFKSRPDRFKLVYQDHFAHVYEMAR